MIGHLYDLAEFWPKFGGGKLGGGLPSPPDPPGQFKKQGQQPPRGYLFNINWKFLEDMYKQGQLRVSEYFSRNKKKS